MIGCNVSLIVKGETKERVDGWVEQGGGGGGGGAWEEVASQADVKVSLLYFHLPYFHDMYDVVKNPVGDWENTVMICWW